MLLLDKSHQSVGGPATFMKNLHVELDRRDYSYVQEKERMFPSVLFFPVTAPLRNIMRVKSLGGRIIQRLDGVYYSSKHGEKYKEHNELMKYIYQNYSDIVVFQSEYSKKQCFESFGQKPEEEYVIITNGANLKLFSPSEEIKRHDCVQLVTTGNIRNEDMISPIIEALDLLHEKGLKFEFRIAGALSTPNRGEILSKNYVVYEGEKDLNGVAATLKASDIFIYSHLNPPCPNSVIEAISCGLPVVGFNSGAMSDLLYFNKDLLAHVSEDVFQAYDDFKPEFLAEKIAHAMENFDRHKKVSLDHSGKYSMKDCAEKYIEVFDKALKMPRGPISPKMLMKSFL